MDAHRNAPGAGPASDQRQKLYQDMSERNERRAGLQSLDAQRKQRIERVLQAARQHWLRRSARVAR